MVRGDFGAGESALSKCDDSQIVQGYSWFLDAQAALFGSSCAFLFKKF